MTPSLSALLRANFERSLEVLRQSMEVLLPGLEEAAQRCADALRTGHKLVLFGNGGSAADAQHLAAEFVGRYSVQRQALPALALTVNASSLTAIANDFGYAQVFARQLEAHVAAEDVVIAISTSGNSESVIEGVKKARELRAFTIALTGRSGGKLRGLVDVLINVPSDETPRIQECHAVIGHSLCDAVERTLFGASSTGAR